MAHPVARKRVDHVIEFFARADFGIQHPVVDNVVAVPASRSCAQVRRAVDVADAKRRQVRDQRRHVGETEFAVQLHAVGRARNRI